MSMASAPIAKRVAWNGRSEAISGPGGNALRRHGRAPRGFLLVRGAHRGGDGPGTVGRAASDRARRRGGGPKVRVDRVIVGVDEDLHRVARCESAASGLALPIGSAGG